MCSKLCLLLKILCVLKILSIEVDTDEYESELSSSYNSLFLSLSTTQIVKLSLRMFKNWIQHLKSNKKYACNIKKRTQ